VIIDLRTYTLYPGKLGEWLRLYREHGYPLQTRFLGEPIFFSTTDVGELNQAVHAWWYPSQAERERRRAELELHPPWVEYRALSARASLIQRQENKLLSVLDWSPARFAP
jgi:hypothetical protein